MQQIEDIKEIIIEGLRGAPSGHNTQPWRFEIVNSEKVIIHPDLSKKLEVVDPDNRELYISIGCALDAFILAASKRKYECTFEVQADRIENAKLNEIVMNIIIIIKKNDILITSPLYPYLSTRQTNRNMYNGNTIDDSTIEKLKDINIEPGVKLYSYGKNDKNFEIIKEYVKKGNENQMNDEKFKNELLSFVRFNPSEVNKYQDGLSYAVFNMPAFPSFISRRVMRLCLTDKQQNKDDMKKIDSSSHIFLFNVEDEEDNYKKIESWIRLGISLESFLLKVASIENLAVAFINQPCEIDELTREFQKQCFHSTDETTKTEIPNILVRVGYVDKKANYSHRKSLDKILIEI